MSNVLYGFLIAWLVVVPAGFLFLLAFARPVPLWVAIAVPQVWGFGVIAGGMLLDWLERRGQR